jgi:hypothetical protein
VFVTSLNDHCRIDTEHPALTVTALPAFVTTWVVASPSVTALRRVRHRAASATVAMIHPRGNAPENWAVYLQPGPGGSRECQKMARSAGLRESSMIDAGPSRPYPPGRKPTDATVPAIGLERFRCSSREGTARLMSDIESEARADAIALLMSNGACVLSFCR